MLADEGDGERTLADVTAAGVDHHALAAQLHHDGADSFVTSWHSLLASIASKQVDSPSRSADVPMKHDDREEVSS